jgi:hypothetical protein
LKLRIAGPRTVDMKSRDKHQIEEMEQKILRALQCAESDQLIQAYYNIFVQLHELLLSGLIECSAE